MGGSPACSRSPVRCRRRAAEVATRHGRKAPRTATRACPDPTMRIRGGGDVKASRHRAKGRRCRCSYADCAGMADRPVAALLKDLKQRGLLDDTLVIWGGEFGRTVYSQGKLSATDYGRDHHPRCFTMWMAGAGVKSGISYGETDDFSYNIIKDPVHVHDLNATILHLLGIDHTKLTFKFQGRHHRLTDVHGKVVEGVQEG